MPDAEGNIKGIAVPIVPWHKKGHVEVKIYRVNGCSDGEHQHDCSECGAETVNGECIRCGLRF